MSRAKGFTLIEVLIALFIVSVSAFSLQSSFSQLFDQSQARSEKVMTRHFLWNVALGDYYGLGLQKEDATQSFAGVSPIIRRSQQPTLVGGLVCREVQVTLNNSSNKASSLFYYQ